jgi:hypothetical protein
MVGGRQLNLQDGSGAQPKPDYFADAPKYKLKWHLQRKD